MKKITLLLVTLFTTTILFAQSVEITPLYGYTISGKVDNYNRTIDVLDDMSFGGMLSVEFDHMSFIELSYLRTNTKAVNTDFVDGRRTTNIGVEQYQVAGLREFKEGKVVPFGRISLGTTRYVQTSDGNDRYWLFSAGLGVGTKIFLTDRVGLRLHTNLILPMEFAGGGFWCGIGSGGSGCGSDIYFNVPLVHWELGGGLIIKLNDI